jgi:hypothetical protein
MAQPAKQILRSRLGQRQIALELLQVVGDEHPSEGLRALRCGELDLARDSDRRQHPIG